MAEAVTPDTLQAVSVNVFGQSGPGIVVQSTAWVARVAENARPLLDGLVVAVDVENVVHVAVEDLHSWVLASVAWVHGANSRSPFRRALLDLAVGALRVPSSDSSRVEASGRFAAKL